MGWASIKNGALLTLADKHFDVFITSDRHISEQQNLSSLKIPILVVPTNNRKKIGQLASALRQSLDRIKPTEFVIMELGSDSERWPRKKLQSIGMGKNKITHVFKNEEENDRDGESKLKRRWQPVHLRVDVYMHQ